MKTIGLLGGMSWESSLEYYRIVNEVTKEILGGLHSAKCILYSVDFHEIEHYQFSGDWKYCGKLLGGAALSLEKAGADYIVICTNTMHKVIDIIETYVNVPIVHIAKETAKELQENKIKKVGLLGTIFTMEEPFYKGILQAEQIEVITPNEEDRQIISNIIYEELCLGVKKEASKQQYLVIMRKLQEAGAEAIILGCTEIGNLVNQQDTKILLFDTTNLHARRAAMLAV